MGLSKRNLALIGFTLPMNTEFNIKTFMASGWYGARISVTSKSGTGMFGVDTEWEMWRCGGKLINIESRLCGHMRDR